MGARPIANLNCLRFGEKSHPKTAWLLRDAVKGIGDYGNCVGIPTVGGSIAFDKSYNGNCLVNAMTVGLIDEKSIFKGFATGPGNLVVYVGSATGRDGIHGATMASDSFASKDSSERSAVQVGDPFMEKLLLEATLAVLSEGHVVGIQDMGAAGLTSSGFEMAERAGTGIWMDLDRVPTRTEGMSAYELLLSESQERMLMVVEPQNWSKLSQELERWQLAYAVIGKVTDTGRFQAVRNGVLECDLPVAAVVENAPRYERPLAPQRQSQPATTIFEVSQIGERVMAEDPWKILSWCLSESGCKLPIYSQYDHHIGNRTVFASSDGGAALLHIREGGKYGKPDLGLAVSATCLERVGAENARFGAMMAVVKAARSIAATGATPLAVTDCLNFGNPEQPVVMREFSDSVDGIALACQKLNTPVVSGNVSLYNETDGQSIFPTPMIGMVGKIDNVRRAVRPAPRSKDSGVILAISSGIGEGIWSGTACSRYFGGNNHNRLAGTLEPDWRSELRQMAILRDRASHFVAAIDVGTGGIVARLAKWLLAAGGKSAIRFSLQRERAFDEFGFSYLICVADQKKADEIKAELTADGIGVLAVATLVANSAPVLDWVGEGQWTFDEIRSQYESFLQFS
jgi:phosphoribosylformylglycinamidine synthase